MSFLCANFSGRLIKRCSNIEVRTRQNPLGMRLPGIGYAVRLCHHFVDLFHATFQETNIAPASPQPFGLLCKFFEQKQEVQHEALGVELQEPAFPLHHKEWQIVQAVPFQRSKYGFDAPLHSGTCFVIFNAANFTGTIMRKAKLDRFG